VVIGPLHLGLELVYSQNNNYWDLCKSTNGIGEKENCLKKDARKKIVIAKRTKEKKRLRISHIAKSIKIKW
jgi:hypothetical protein